MANTGFEVLALKRLGRWTSSSIAESYIANSLTEKIKWLIKFYIAKVLNTEIAGISSSQCKYHESPGVIIELSNADNDIEII